jgi:hypothetical protein
VTLAPLNIRFFFFFNFVLKRYATFVLVCSIVCEITWCLHTVCIYLPTF